MDGEPEMAQRHVEGQVFTALNLFKQSIFIGFIDFNIF